ncbi:MAG: hypothetical protein EHM18_17465 [Acidobacteria bacterium]|nr:MAG: hypothetical protein EHM18_17465 [Acidobacteriota bacterium]
MTNLTRLVVLVVFFTGLVHAQLVKYNDDAFGSGAITLDVEAFRPGADATALFSKYGVRFSGKESTPRVAEFSWPPIPVTPGTYHVVRNQANEGSSAGRPLRIDFTNAPRQVGFSLRNPGVTASVTAFDPDGISLGSVQQAAAGSGDLSTKVRLWVPAGRVISKVIIDYGSSSVPEEILDLTLDHKDRPMFETFLPQVADGELPDGLHLRTAITIVGLTNSTVTGDIRFRGADGQPLLVTLNEGDPVNWKPVNSFDDNLTITAGTSTPAVAGYAKVYTTSPVAAVAAFQITGNNGVVISETSVLSTAARHNHSGPVWEVVPSGMVGGGVVPPRYQTALAIANAAWEKNMVRIELTGHTPVEFELAPGQHKANFVWELFPDLFDQDFQGWLRISSSRPTVAVLLKTKDGLPVSAVPLESLEP